MLTMRYLETHCCNNVLLSDFTSTYIFYRRMKFSETTKKRIKMDKKGARGMNPRRDRKRPAKFKGTNRHFIETDTSFASTSAAKIARKSPEFDVRIDQTFSYVFIEFFMVFGALQQLLKCKKCDSDVKFYKKSIRGLGFKICVQCLCSDPAEINSSPLIDHAYEINRRFCFVMRILGIGIHGIRNFTGLMDLTSTFNSTTYYGIMKTLHIVVKTVYETIIRKAGSEEKEKTLEAENQADILTVSGDGSWSKRGFTSRMGIVSVIGKYTNKVLDVAVRSSFCRACSLWKGRENTVEYDAWYATHEPECNVNHEGSAGKMEVDGMIEIFERSEKTHNAKYGYYIGDGDTKTFKMLLEAKPYGDDFTVKKKECVLHVKKRVYKRGNEARKRLVQLKKAKKQIADKQEKTEPEKKTIRSSISKRGKNTTQKPAAEPKKVQLTLKLLTNLSEYYGLAVRRNSDSVQNMRNAIWATFYHKSSTDENPQHQYCPSGGDSWCEWRKAEANGFREKYSHPPALDDDVQEVLKPIYEDLTTDDLLDRCTGANTQNNNESFNHCVWQLAPKHIFCGKQMVEIATYCAACTFNEGFDPILKILETMGCTIGPIAADFAAKYKAERIKIAERRNSLDSKEARTARRNKFSAEKELFEEAEGILYGPGIAD